MPDSFDTSAADLLKFLRRPAVLGALAVALAAAEIFLDVATWIELNIAIIYSLPLVLAAAARSRRLLWSLAFMLVLTTFVVYWLQDAQGRPSPYDEYFINRSLAAVTILLAAALLHALSKAAEALQARNEQLAATQRELMQRNRELDLQRAEAEDASDRKTRLLMSVSHDVRSPLTSINLMAELISDAASSADRLAMLPRLAQDLRSNAQSLGNLVTDVLDIAYFDSGRIELRDSEFSLNDLMAEEGRSLEPQAGAKGLSLTLQLPQPAVWLRADRIKLARVLRNLATNAIRFTPHGGVTVAARLIEDGGLAIQVTDTGVGVAPEHLERIFAEFTQFSRQTSPDRPGWGLGLAICRRLTRLMGGEVSVESVPGRGSTFTVHLPPSRVLERPDGRHSQETAP
jgi:signal transduction histidine kinase